MLKPELPSDDTLHALAQRVGDLLLATGHTLVTAESCTGGWIAKTITDIPGCSAWFEFGYVSYGNDAKVTCLGVSPDTLAAHGAVRQDVAEQMATGARLAAAAEVAVAITGLAGPDGGTVEKPVGTVWMAWAGPGPQLLARQFRFEGNREAVRR